MTIETICPVCGGSAQKDTRQEGTIYCNDSDCGFMGIVPA